MKTTWKAANIWLLTEKYQRKRNQEESQKQVQKTYDPVLQRKPANSHSELEGDFFQEWSTEKEQRSDEIEKEMRNGYADGCV